MHSTVGIWRHSLGMLVFVALFLAGKLMVADCRKWATALTGRRATSGPISNFFLYSGKFFEVVAVVAGFVEAVAVMVLASGWLVDLVSTFGVAE